ncbi:hypothetical protein [Paenibacillus kandeliae]|uniref:hypothetical protein n=1 Tax=Paenibacillus kandeliae TaxID=3231269 RepID=UPI00345A3A30
MNLGTGSWKKAVAVWMSGTMLAGAFIMVQPEHTYAAANLTPTYEVKFVLDQDVLNGDYTPTAALTSAFALPSKPQKIAVEYFDTNDQKLNGEGWNVRLRKKEDKSKYEITYKKRYAITNGDIDAALTQANKEGFDANDTNYEAEVDWGYGKQTLSLSNDKDSKTTDTGAVLPSQSKALELVLDKLPGKLQNWKSSNWGKDQLKNSRAYGPVIASKYEGSWNGVDIDVEVWPVRNASGTGTEPVTEISFKADSYSEASVNRQQLLNDLQAKGWLLPQDSLKTQLVLDRY